MICLRLEYFLTPWKVATGPQESTISVSARTLITVTLLSFSVCLSLKKTNLPPMRGASIVTVTKANHKTKLSSAVEAFGQESTFTFKTLQGQTFVHHMFVPWYDLNIGFPPVYQTSNKNANHLIPLSNIKRGQGSYFEGPALNMCAALLV